MLHQLLGENVAAHVLATVYLLFLPISPVSLIVWLVWSRNISYGYWYATAQCLAWALGTVSYYVLPDARARTSPSRSLYADLDETGVTSLQDSLYYGPPGRAQRAADHRLDPERRRLRLPARRRSS